jgi:hypothetical protein
MSDVQLSDVTIHIDAESDDAVRGKVEAALRAIDGTVSVHMPDDARHMVVVEYVPDKTKSGVLLAAVRDMAGQAELIGL